VRLTNTFNVAYGIAMRKLVYDEILHITRLGYRRSLSVGRRLVALIGSDMEARGG
jgi:hypothetical protein